MTHPDHVVPARPRPTDPAAGRAGLSALTAGLTPKRPAEGAIQAALERARGCRNGRTRPARARQGWPAWRRSPCARPTGRRTRPTCRRGAAARASASPSTSCSPTSWPSPWCGRARSGRAAASPSGDGRLRSRGAGRPALPPDTLAAALGRRDPGRHGRADAHAAPAAGRCRQRQDGGRADGDAGRRRGRRAGGADGADRDPRPPAPRKPRTACRRRRAPARAADRPRQGQGADRDPGAGRQWRSGAGGGDPCGLPGGRALPQSAAGGGRRAAPLRRASAAGAGREGPGRRHPGDDRDADPAHADADGLWRHGVLAARREAARPPADRHPPGLAGAPGGGHRRHRPRAGAGSQGLLGLPAGRGLGCERPGRRRGTPRRC